MSDDEKPEIDLELQIAREGDALSRLNEIIAEFNGEKYLELRLIEESLLIYLTTRMAASANGENGEEHFSRDDILRITKAGVNMGKDVIEQGRKDGTLPRPFKLIKPTGLH